MELKKQLKPVIELNRNFGCLISNIFIKGKNISLKVETRAKNVASSIDETLSNTFGIL